MLRLLFLLIDMVFLNIFNLLLERHYPTLQLVFNTLFVTRSILMQLFNRLLVIVLELINLFNVVFL